MAAATTLLTATALCSCDNGCEETRESYMYLAFTSTSGRSLSSVTVYPQSAGLTPTGTKYTTFTDVKVPLSAKDSVILLILEATYTYFGDSFTDIDSIKVHYTSQPKFLNMDCGCTIDFDIQQLDGTYHMFTNYIVSDPSVVPDNTSNINIEY